MTPYTPPPPYAPPPYNHPHMMNGPHGPMPPPSNNGWIKWVVAAAALSGAQPFPKFKKLIDRALSEAR